MPQQANIVDKQMLDYAIPAQAPDEPNRVFVCTGKLQVGFYASETNGQEVEKTFTALIEPNPPLTARQFHRAIATASIANVQLQDTQPNLWDHFRWGVVEAQADLDDETGQAELRVTVMIATSGPGTWVGISDVAFQVTILARV